MTATTSTRSRSLTPGSGCQAFNAGQETMRALKMSLILLGGILSACDKSTETESRQALAQLPRPGRDDVGSAPLNLNGVAPEAGDAPFLGICVTVYNARSDTPVGIPARWLENDVFWFRHLPDGQREFGRWPAP
jgi:hypothetical protein